MAALGVVVGLGSLPSALHAATDVDEPVVVVVMIDGFSPKLLDRAETPTLNRLRKEGRYSDTLKPVFPSLSHPNWTSLATGCWPSRHGILSNQFEIKGVVTDFATITDADTVLACQSINQVAEAQGVRVAALGWTGARSTRDGDHASVIEPFFESWGADWDEARALQMVEQLQRVDAERPRLVLAYFNGPDHAQHDFGVDSEEAIEAVELTDRALGVLMVQLDAMAAKRGLTLLVVTDHGMTMATRTLNVAKLLKHADVDGHFVADGPIAFIHLDDPSDKQSAMAKLDGDQRYIVVDPKAQPENWHLGNSPRTGDLVLYTSVPYFFPMDRNMPSWLPAFGRWWPVDMRIQNFVRRIGMHGYNVVEQPDMNGIFIAWGAGVSGSGRLDSEVRAIDLHSTVAKRLGIEPGLPQDGRVVEELFR